MIDMLVRLHEIGDFNESYTKPKKAGVTLRRARAYERHIVSEWVGEHFSPKWQSETKVAFSRQPISCYIATRKKKILGFVCYDVTAPGHYGPSGVLENERGAGLGRALLFKALEGLKNLGYVYGIIGGVGPREFYEKNCKAIEIPGSDPGIYRDILPD